MKKIKKLLKIYSTEGPRAAIRSGVDYLINEVPDFVILILYPITTFLHPKRKFSYISKVDGLYRFNNTGAVDYYVPRLTAPLVRIRDFEHGDGAGTIKTRVEKYKMAGFVEVEDDDVVIDVGAFIGAFSLGTADRAKKVIAVEPGEKSAECIRRNAYIQSVQNICVINKAMSDEQSTVTLNLSRDPTDHSIIAPDTRVSGSTTVSSTTIDKVYEISNHIKIDFLKIDAEGAEPEVISGWNEASIEKLAIDCSKERQGKSTFNELNTELSNRGYSTKRRNTDSEDVIFGRSNR